MKHGEALGGWFVRYRLRLNVVALIACGVWAGWMAWMTRPDNIGLTAMGSPICCFRAVK